MTRKERRALRSKLHNEVKRTTGETIAPIDMRLKLGWAHSRTNVFSREGAGRQSLQQRTKTDKGYTFVQYRITSRTVKRNRISAFSKPGHIFR